MLFNSLDFLFFFIVVFSLYWLIPSQKVIVRNFFVLAASYFFYGYWDWRFLGLIVISTFADFFIGKQIASTKKSQQRKWLLFSSLAINLGILGYFKYFNFFAAEFAQLLEGFGVSVGFNTLNIILPVGISFYTFQTLSYTIDIYRGSVKPSRSLLQFAVFVAFFPQLVAGPIERAAKLLPQFENGKRFDYELAKHGAVLMLYGFFKKVVIADNLARFVDPVFDKPDLFGGYEVILACFAFSIQLYTDFSGYSDIAIGLAALFGFTLSTNFKTPFFSASIKEFWQRWHISLST